MRRRDFIKLLGGAAAAWPLAAGAQQAALPVVGYLSSGSAAAFSYEVTAFRQGLNEAGFAAGRNVTIEYRWAEDRLERLPALAGELVAGGAAAILTNNQSAPAAIAATSTIPIVIVTGGDPAETGFVTSLSRPGGNVTGVSFSTTPLNPKRLELLHELVAAPAVIGVLFDPNVITLNVQIQAIEMAARALGREILIVKAGTEAQLIEAFVTIGKAGARGLFVGSGAFYTSCRREIAALAIRYALPAVCQSREVVEVGGLMSYGASFTDAFRRGGVYVGRILKGAKPADLPVEFPTKYELVINLATAKAIGLAIPASLLARADEVIE